MFPLTRATHLGTGFLSHSHTFQVSPGCSSRPTYWRKQVNGKAAEILAATEGGCNGSLVWVWRS